MTLPPAVPLRSSGGGAATMSLKKPTTEFVASLVSIFNRMKAKERAPINAANEVDEGVCVQDLQGTSGVHRHHHRTTKGDDKNIGCTLVDDFHISRGIQCDGFD